MPELKDLMQDSVISLAHLSEVQTPVVSIKEPSSAETTFEEKVLKEFKAHADQAKITSQQTQEVVDEKKTD